MSRTGEHHTSPSDEAAQHEPLAPTSVSQDQVDNEAFHTAVTGLQEALVTEMSGVVGRMITSTLTEADAVVRRARAEAQRAIDETIADLATERREKEAFAQLVQEAQADLSKLKAELEAERERANAARDECQALQSVRARAEEAEAARQEVVATYEARLGALQAELDAQSSERAKLSAVLQTVQQTVAASGPDRAAPRTRRHQPDRAPGDEPNRGGQTPKRDEAVSQAEIRSASESVPDASAPVRSLKLVPSNQQTPIDAPRELLEHVKQLLDEIEVMYWADLESAERPADVVERLTVNLRYAWDLFTRRMPADGGSSAAVFEQQLSALLDAKSATSFGRHLSIAAHQIVARTEAAAAQGRASGS